MAPTDSTSSPRDHAADANPDLARKKQRLSEDPGASPESVIVELCDTEDIGTNMDNAIEIEDDLNIPMEPYSQDFFFTSSRASPFEQICSLQADLQQNSYIDPDVFIQFSHAITTHIRRTASERQQWKQHYLEDEADFFLNLATLSFNLLRAGDVFEPREETATPALRNALTGLLKGLGEICRRIIPFLPDAVKAKFSRRDSAQVTAKQQGIGSLYYVAVAVLVLSGDSPTTQYFQNYDRHLKLNQHFDSLRMTFAEDSVISSLTAVIKMLSGAMREVKDSWFILQNTLTLFNVALKVRLSSNEYPDEEVEAVMEVLNTCILPVVCEKHPRALPDNFHEGLIAFGADALSNHVQCKDAASAYQVYERFVKGTSDALVPESSDNDSMLSSLLRMCDKRQDVLAQLLATSWALQTAKSFVCSDIMDIRTVGINSLHSQLVTLFNQARCYPEKFEHPSIQYAVRFLRKNDITGYIFGPESRAGLVSQSADIICFLAATYTYTNVETDIIWRACSTSVEADFVKASFGVLRKLTNYLSFELLIHVLKKYSVTPVGRLSVDAVDFLPELLKNLEQKSCTATESADRLALAYVGIDILKHVNSYEPSPFRNQLHNISMAEIARFAGPSFQPDDRAGIFERCIPEILGHTQHATTTVEVLNIMLSSRLSSQETQNILRDLSVTTAVDELCNFVRTKKEQHIMQFNPRDVTVRLCCIARLMALTTATPDTNTQERLFTYVFGEKALSNGARNAAWETLNSMAATNDPPSAATGLWQGYMQDYVPYLSANVATPRLIEFVSASLKAEFANEAMKTDMTYLTSLPLWSAVVRFATSSPEDAVVNGAVNTILDLLFTYPMVTLMKPTVVAQCQVVFVRDHVESLRNLGESYSQSKNSLDLRNFIVGMNLLEAVLRRSRDTLSTYGFAKEPDVLMVGDLKDEARRITFTAQVYGPETQPKLLTVHARESTKVAELLTKLPNYTGADQSRVIAGGTEITDFLDATLSEAGVRQSGVILIRPRYTFDSDLDKVLTCPGPVEQAILTQYSSVEALVDGPEETAHRTLCLLQNVRLPAQPRFEVVSGQATSQDLFPGHRPNRTRFSLFVLRRHVFDFTRLGVADRDFIVRAVHLLAEFVLDTSRAFDPLLMLDVLNVLAIFLRERPKTGEAPQYFENHERLASRLIDLLFETKQMLRDRAVPPGVPVRTTLAVAVYQTLLLACQTSEAVWKAFTAHDAVVTLHTQLLLDDDVEFSSQISQPIRNLCQDASFSREVPNFYWRATIPGLSDALAKGPLSGSYFKLVVDILHCEQDLQNDEPLIRGLIQALTTELWSYQHTESPPLLITDKAMAGLLRLLCVATNVLRSHKKPLGLHELPTRLFRQLLFPQADDQKYRPLVQEETRGLVYDLIRATFAPRSDYESLIDLAYDATLKSIRETTARFPGISDFVRSPCNGAGLHNLGMTCYMNSLLQQLFANLQFRKFILSQPTQNPQKQDILIKVRNLFAQMQNKLEVIAEPGALAAALNVQIGVQEDVHTFYTTLLSRLEESMPDKGSQITLTRFFTGRSITQVKGVCGHVSSRVEPFTELSITVKNKASLQDSLDEFVQGEPLEGANKYMCMSCASDNGGQLVNAMKRTCLDEIPDNLTFCLKRFAFDSILEGENKVNDRFEFPAEIDMSVYKRDYLEDPEVRRNPDMFELVGVIVHQGSLSYGHYWSYIRVPGSSSPHGVWMYLEDAKCLRVAGGVREVQEQCFGGLKWIDGSERPESAYVLFYQRKGYIAQAEKLNSVPKNVRLKHQVLPMVDIMEPLASEIHNDNLWRLKVGSLFSSQFSSFVTWLLGQLLAVLDARQGKFEGSESPEESPSTVDSSFGDLEAKIGDFIFTYAQRILLADPNGENKVPPLTSSLTTILKEKPTVAAHILKCFSEDSFGFTSITHNRSPKVRAQMFALVETCFACFRQLNPDSYEAVLAKLIWAHSSLLGPTLDTWPGHWNEYLAFAANVAGLSSFETHLILDSRYLDWVLEVLYLRWDPEAKKKHVALYSWMRNNSVDLAPLFEFLYRVLNGGVDLSVEFEQLALPTEDRTETVGLWCLRQHELQLLLKTRTVNANGKVLWLLFQSACRSCSLEVPWKDFSPGKLLGLLVGEGANLEILRHAEELMLSHFDLEEEQLVPLLNMALHFCLNRPDDECKLILKGLSKNLILWDTSERRCLWFYREAYKLAPTAVVESVPIWAAEFLRVKGTQNRQAAGDWLQDHLFAPPSLSENSSLDASRMRTTRELSAKCKVTLTNAYTVGEIRGRYESMIQALQHASEYLTALQAEVKQRQDESEDGDANLAKEVQVEYEESKGVLAGLRQLAQELEGWEEETSLPTRTLGVRRSVEAGEESEDLETSEAEGDEMSSEP